MSWLLLLFDKHFTNYLQISSKYSNTMLSICKTSLKKYVLEADENGRMFFITNFRYIFSNANGIEKTKHLQAKISTFVNSIKRSTCCNARLNIMMKQ